MLSEITTGHAVAEVVVALTGSRNVFTIAAMHGVRIRFGSWFPVTLGEFERVENVITLNRTTFELPSGRPSEIQVIAHELGHFFASRLDLDRLMEEKFANDFACSLVGEVPNG